MDGASDIPDFQPVKGLFGKLNVTNYILYFGRLETPGNCWHEQLAN